MHSSLILNWGPFSCFLLVKLCVASWNEQRKECRYKPLNMQKIHHHDCAYLILARRLTFIFVTSSSVVVIGIVPTSTTWFVGWSCRRLAILFVILIPPPGSAGAAVREGHDQHIDDGHNPDDDEDAKGGLAKFHQQLKILGILGVVVRVLIVPSRVVAALAARGTVTR